MFLIILQLKLKRARKYDLSDGEEDDIEVHQTQTLSERDDFEEEIPLDDDDKGVFVGIENIESHKATSNLDLFHGVADNYKVMGLIKGI